MRQLLRLFIQYFSVLEHLTIVMHLLDEHQQLTATIVVSAR